MPTAISGLSNLASLAAGDVVPVTDVSDTTQAAGGSTKKTTIATVAAYVVGSDAELSAIAGLTSAADTVPYFTGSGTASLTSLTSTARSLLDDTSTSAMRTTLGLGSGATAALATEAQAQDGTSDVLIMTPLQTANVSAGRNRTFASQRSGKRYTADSTAVDQMMALLIADAPTSGRITSPIVAEGDEIIMGAGTYTMTAPFVQSLSTGSSFGVKLKGKGTAQTMLVLSTTASAATFRPDGTTWRAIDTRPADSGRQQEWSFEDFSIVCGFTQGGDGTTPLADACRIIDTDYLQFLRVRNLRIHMRNFTKRSENQFGLYTKRNYYQEIRGLIGYATNAVDGSASMNGTATTNYAGILLGIENCNAMDVVGITATGMHAALLFDNDLGAQIYGVKAEHTNLLAIYQNGTHSTDIWGGYRESHKLDNGSSLGTRSQEAIARFGATTYDNRIHLSQGQSEPRIRQIIDRSPSQSNRLIVNGQYQSRAFSIRSLTSTEVASSVTVAASSGAAPANFPGASVRRVSWPGNYGEGVYWTHTFDPRAGSIRVLTAIKRISGPGLMKPMLTSAGLTGSNNVAWGDLLDPLRRHENASSTAVPDIDIASSGNSYSSSNNGEVTLTFKRPHLLQIGQRTQSSGTVGTMTAGTNLYVRSITSETVAVLGLASGTLSDPGSITSGSLTLPSDMYSWLGQDDATRDWLVVDRVVPVSYNIVAISLNGSNIPVITLDRTCASAGIVNGSKLTLWDFNDSRLHGVDYDAITGDISGSTITLTALGAMSTLDVTSAAANGHDTTTVYGKIGFRELRVAYIGKTNGAAACEFDVIEPVVQVGHAGNFTPVIESAIGSSITVQDEGTPLSTAATTLNFVGSGVAATGTGATKTITISSGGDAVTTNPLSQFAATTSTQLRGVISDETGTGSLVFGTSPTITTPTFSGITTRDGADITTPNAMAALAIDVTKFRNTKSISADSTFTFSATATSGAWFGMHLTNSDTAGHTITIPSSYSMVRNATITTLVIPASGQLWLVWQYDGTTYRIFGEPGSNGLNNFGASTNPGVNDDSADGYGPGSLWVNTTTPAAYICITAAAGAADWNQIDAGGGGGLSATGTPTDGQVGVWTSSSALEGDAALSFDTTTDLLTVGAGSLTRVGAHALTLTTSGTTNVTFPTSGTLLASGGALGTPSSGTVTNLTGTASININGTVGATTPTTGVFTTLVAGSTTSLLLGTAGSAVGNIGFRNATSGTATMAPPTGALGTYTVTLPNAASTLPIFGQQITFAGPTAARTVTLPDASFTAARTDAAQTFTGTQTFGAVVGTTWNGNTWATGTGTLSIGAGKTLTASNSITFAGTDSTTMTFPGASANVGYLEVPSNSQSAAYTAVLADSGKSIDHPSTDANARTFTIPANASVAYPVGTCISFSNMTSQAVTIAITTDTMYLAGTGTTGSRTLAQYGTATARKLTSTTWLIWGVGLT